MKFFLRISVLLLLVTGTLTQDGFDLLDALDDDAPPTAKPKPKTTEKPKINDGLDLADAFGPDDPPTVKPNKPNSGNSGGGGSFGDSDLLEIGGGGDYKPDANGGGGSQDSHDAADQPQEAGSGQIAGIASAIGVALLGAASSYFAYQKKKLCFKIQGGADPEKGHQVTQSEPQVFSTLLSTS